MNPIMLFAVFDIINRIKGLSDDLSTHANYNECKIGCEDICNNNVADCNTILIVLQYNSDAKLRH